MHTKYCEREASQLDWTLLRHVNACVSCTLERAQHSALRFDRQLNSALLPFVTHAIALKFE